jgi:low affinity Fe/Cu permease
MVFLIQNTQNRDTEALQLKLELIRAHQKARKRLLQLEDLTLTGAGTIWITGAGSGSSSTTRRWCRSRSWWSSRRSRRHRRSDRAINCAPPAKKRKLMG